MENIASFYNKIIKDEKILTQTLSLWKFKGQKIVFTNGCFDILHRGHVEYLYQASLQGDRLILGLNTDASISRIKGPDRPINNQDARAIVLAALEFIDTIVLFDEDTPYELIKTVKPNVLVKGDDYKPEEIVGYDIVHSNGGKVVTVPMVEGFSTTSTLSKLKKGI